MRRGWVGRLFLGEGVGAERESQVGECCEANAIVHPHLCGVNDTGGRHGEKDVPSRPDIHTSRASAWEEVMQRSHGEALGL